MPDYTYIGENPVDFIVVSVPGASFSVKPGDIISLEVDPNTPDFVPAVKASKTSAAPIAPATVPDVSGADLAPSQTTPAPEEQ
jgi:hypothetical protein